MICVNCGSGKIQKNGRTESGTPRLRCGDCGKSWNSENNLNGRPPDLAYPKSGYEHFKNYLHTHGISSSEYKKLSLARKRLRDVQ